MTIYLKTCIDTEQPCFYGSVTRVLVELRSLVLGREVGRGSNLQTFASLSESHCLWLEVVPQKFMMLHTQLLGNQLVTANTCSLKTFDTTTKQLQSLPSRNDVAAFF